MHAILKCIHTHMLLLGLICLRHILNTHRQTQVHACTHAYVYIQAHTSNTCTHAYICTHSNTHRHTRNKYMHTYIHIQSCMHIYIQQDRDNQVYCNSHKLSLKQICELDVLAQSCHLGTGEAETGGREFETRLGYLESDTVSIQDQRRLERRPRS